MKGIFSRLFGEYNQKASPAWREEVCKRCREIDEGSVKLRDAEDVFARGCAALGWLSTESK